MSEEIEKLYRILELEIGASLEDVKQSYRLLAKVWHPDRFSSNDSKILVKAHEKIKEINGAYKTLFDHLTKSSHQTSSDQKETKYEQDEEEMCKSSKERQRKQEEARRKHEEEETQRFKEKARRKADEELKKQEEDEEIRKYKEAAYRKAKEEQKRHHKKIFNSGVCPECGVKIDKNLIKCLICNGSVIFSDLQTVKM